MKAKEKEFINEVIENIENNPDNYTSRWANEYTVSNSIQNRKDTILIYKDGTLLKPYKMKSYRRKELETLVKKIMDRDVAEILNNIEL
jgi:hypothetical protein